VCSAERGSSDWCVAEHGLSHCYSCVACSLVTGLLLWLAAYLRDLPDWVIMALRRLLPSCASKCCVFCCALIANGSACKVEVGG
jgi:hypothetical protein